MPFLYFIQAGGTDGPVKIGFSADPEKRIAELRTGNHLPLTLRAKVEHARAAELERALHGELAADRLEGEWFAHSDRLDHIIDILVCGPNKVPPSVRARAEKSTVPGARGPGVFVVEWSERQGCIHIDHLDDVVDMNRLALLFGKATPTDYAVIAIALSRDDAMSIADMYEPWLCAMRTLRRISALPEECRCPPTGAS